MYNNENAVHLRNVFLEAESDYVAELMKKQGMFKFIMECAEEKDSRILFAAAQKLVDKIESGLVLEEELERVESQIIVLLAAIQDKVFDKIILPYENKDKKNPSL